MNKNRFSSKMDFKLEIKADKIKAMSTIAMLAETY